MNKISVFLAQAIGGRRIGLTCDTRKKASAKKVAFIKAVGNGGVNMKGCTSPRSLLSF
jgi:hypothetical protein